MKLIASADKNWGIGKNGDLLFHASPDMKFFKSMTTGNIVVLGISTFLSLPHQKPLPDRRNIVLTHRDLHIDGIETVHDIAELNELLKGEDGDRVFVIGGASVYSQLLPLCDTAYITRFDAEREADRFLPDLDQNDEWYLAERSDTVEHNGLRFTFDTYKRKTQ